MSLETWLANGWLKHHQTSPSEIAELLGVADQALANARVDGLTPDARIGLAYPAALALGAMALAAEGYRADRVRHHERVIGSFQYTVILAPSKLNALNRLRRTRNEMTYERVGTQTATEAAEILSLVEDLREETLDWLRLTHAGLL